MLVFMPSFNFEISLGEILSILAVFLTSAFAFFKSIENYNVNVNQLSNLLKRVIEQNFLEKDLADRECEFSPGGNFIHGSSFTDMITFWFKEYLEGPIKTQSVRDHLEIPLYDKLIFLKKKKPFICLKQLFNHSTRKLRRNVILFLKTQWKTGQTCLDKYGEEYKYKSTSDRIKIFIKGFIDKINDMQVIDKIDENEVLY